MSKFDKETDNLINNTNKMCKLASEMISKAVTALETGDVKLAEEVINLFDHVDRYDVEIERESFRIMTLYQPVVSDMRAIAACLKCITYLERIAKYSKNIAGGVIYLSDKESFPVKSLLTPMGEKATEMVAMSTKAFEDRSIEGIDKIVDLDNFLDWNMQDYLQQMIAYMGEHPESVDVCTYYISILKYLERVGDHACKIAEKVTFMVTGMRTRLS